MAQRNILWSSSWKPCDVFFLMLASMCFHRQIMCKVVTMLGKDTVEHLLLPRFCNLCSDARLFQVRKVPTPPPVTGWWSFPFFFFFFFFSNFNAACAACFCLSQLPPGPPSISNGSSNLFSLRVNSWRRHVSLNSVMYISLAHSALLSSRGILIPCN